MRKDVKLGLAIGAVLFSVIVAYLLVATGPSSKNHKRTAQLNGATGVVPGGFAGPGGTDTAPPAAAASAGNTAAAADLPRAGEAARADAAHADAGAPARPAADAPPADGAEGRFNWAAALTEGQPVPAADAAAVEAGNVPARTETPADPTASAGHTPAPPARADAAAPADPPVVAVPDSPARTESPADPTPRVVEAVARVDAPRVEEPARSELPLRSDPLPIAEGTRPVAAAPATRPSGTYTVKPGENFWKIAEKAYGNGAYYTHLVRANPKLDPKSLKAGMTIVIPDAAQIVQPSTPRAVAATPAPTTQPLRADQYRVQRGDTLEGIARKLYGKPEKWEKIYEANRQTIGSDPGKLKLGMVLQLPESPIAATH